MSREVDTRSGEKKDGRFTRREVIAGAIGGAAGFFLPQFIIDRINAPTRERIHAIEEGLSQGKVVRNVRTAVDHELFFPGGYIEKRTPAGISNPLVFNEETYGYVSYDETGAAEVVIAPEGSKLVAFPPGADLGEDRVANPRIEGVDISRVYYESTSGYDEIAKHYHTTLDHEPGLLTPEADVPRVAALFYVGF